MKLLKTMTMAAAGAALVAGTFAASYASAAEMHIPSTVYRTGAYAVGGIPLADGFSDYFNMINARDGGVNGVKLVVTECDTGYKTDRGVECYDRTKNEHGGALVYNPWSTGITYALIEKATADKIPVLSMGYGRTSAAVGSVFPYVFNFPTSYWSQATAIVRYIAEQEGGLDKLKGKRIAYIYLDHPYGKEPIPTLDILAKKFGFTYDKYPVPPKSMTEQKSTWLQIRKTRPDYAVMWGWGAMNSTAIKEASNIKFKMDHFIGNWWAGAEPDAQPAGKGAIGYKSANFHGVGTGYKVYDDLKKHIYDAGKAAGDGSKVGQVLYNRGMTNAALVVEAIRTAQAKFGNKAINSEEMRWGLENLNLSADQIEKLGLTGLVPPVKVSCNNHEGDSPAVKIQQWDGTKYNTVTDWIPAMTDVVRPLMEQDAAQYAKEKGINPASCS